MSTERRTVYILSTYGMGIQNGGLCQFFVNSSRLLAPSLDECFETVGAEEHRKLLADFVANNSIDFDCFDNAYYELAPLQDFIVNYIKTNVTEF